MKMAGTIDSIFSKNYKIHIINKKKYKDWVIKAHEGPTNGYWYAPEKRADLFDMEDEDDRRHDLVVSTIYTLDELKDVNGKITIDDAKHLLQEMCS